MIQYLFLLAIILVAIPGLLWGIKKQDNLIQFPFFLSMILLGFFVPQGFAVAKNNSIDNLTYGMFTLQILLCTLFSYIGYFYYKPQIKNKKIVKYDKSKIFLTGVVLMFISYIFHILLFILPAEVTTGPTTGLPVYYLFFARILGYPAVVLLLISLINKKSNLKIIFFLMSLLPFLYRTFFLGKRSTLINLSVILICCLYFYKNIKPTRKLAIYGIVIALLVLILFPAFRSNDTETSINVFKEIGNYFSGENAGPEFKDASKNLMATLKTGKYGFGAGIYNSFIHLYFPGSILGQGSKNSLYINYQLFKESRIEVYTEEAHPFLHRSGFADSFFEFSFLGCILFLFVSIGSKTLFLRAKEKGDQYKLLYCMLSPLSVYFIITSAINLPAQAITSIIMFLIINKIVKQK